MSLSLTQARRLRAWVYGGGFFLSAGLALAAYLNSSLLSQFMTEQQVGLVYALTYLGTFVLTLYLHRLIEKIGVYQTVLSLVFLGAVVRIILAGLATWPVAIPLLILDLILSFLLVASLDLYLEHLSENNLTGWIRGLFLGLGNLAWLISPWFAGQLATHYGFNIVYLASGLTFIPLFFIAARRLIVLPKRTYHHTGVWATLKRLASAPEQSRGRDTLRIISVDFILQFFYATMVIYLPILLLQENHFSWSEVGLILTIMLVPFVIIDFLLGRIADKIGEKEFIISGLILAGLATLVIPFLHLHSVIIWGIILLTTRIGAATVELMKESYLFKQISSQDISVIFLSRSMYPLSYVVAPLVATLLLTFTSTANIFALLGLIVLSTVVIAGKIKDTN